MNVDVVVVGGGVIGLSIAWRAAQLGLSVTVVDRGDRARASWAAAGMLAPVTEVCPGEDRLLALSLRSAQMYPGFVSELEAVTGLATGYRREGSLLVALDGDDHAVHVELHNLQRRLGLSARRLDRREARELEPGLHPSVRSVLLVEGDHQVDNRRLLAALRTAAARAGASFVVGCAVVEVASGRVTGVRTSAGEAIAASTVVVAGGCWSNLLPGVPDEARPTVRPVKGQILRLRSHAPGHVIGRTVRALVHGSGVYLVPRADGEIVVGATVEERGFDATVTAGAVAELLRDARAVVPDIAECELVETWAGLRPGSPDNAPIVGPSPIAGLVIATGHFRNGILLAPITAAAIARLLDTGALPDDMAGFVPARHDVCASAGGTA